jgi:parallel beta-helix repeat protein
LELQTQFKTVTQERSQLYAQLSNLQSQLETVAQERVQLNSQASQSQTQSEKSEPERSQAASQLPEQSQLAKKVIPETKALRRSGLIVSQKGQGDYSTISEAIDSAKPGTRIFVRPGLYRESLIIDKPLEIIGDGVLEEIVIKCEDSNCLLMQTDRAFVRGLTFSETGRHYAVNIPQGQLVIEECDLTANSNYSVVAIGGSTANPIIRGCQIRDGKWNGIWASNNARGTVEDCEIFDNGSTGIGIGQGANLVIRRCQINWNGRQAIGVYNKGSATVEDCDLTDNDGGAWDIARGGYVRSSRNQDGKTLEEEDEG